MSGEGRHVLVVEDDGELRKLLLTLLRRSGFRASGARDGIEMRRLLASAQVDLVLLDIMLPGKSGFELCRDLRAEGRIPVIILTALAATLVAIITVIDTGSTDARRGFMKEFEAIIALGPTVPVVTIGWCLAQLGANATLAPFIATISDQVPKFQRGSVSPGYHLP